mgnify:CR=1 FL=1
MQWHIEKSTSTDIDSIFELYHYATDYQKSKGAVQWPQFDQTMVENEILEGRQWKLVQDEAVVCVWVITFDDPQIWEERNIDPAVYIHRIATHPQYRGQNLVVRLVDWAKAFALQNGKQYLRMDTAGNNQGLINYYTRCGFQFLGLRHLKNPAGLPAHYQTGPISLFQIDLTSQAL